MSGHKKWWINIVKCSGTALPLLMLPLLVRDPYELGILIVLLLNIFLALSLYPVLKIGLFSLGHAGFMAIGAYTSVILVVKGGVNFWVSLLLAGLCAGAVSVMLGYFCLRARGLFFAVITFGFSEVVRITINNLDIFGGSEGISNIAAPELPLPWGSSIEFSSRIAYFYLMLVFAVAMTIFVYRMQKSRLGLIYSAVRTNDTLAESLGINCTKHRLLVFGIGCFCAGLGGSLLAHYYRFVSPNEFTIWLSIYTVMYSQVGGMASPLGPILGVLLLTLVPEVFRFSKAYLPLISGGILIGVMMKFPEGLLGLKPVLNEILKRIRRFRPWQGEKES